MKVTLKMKVEIPELDKVRIEIPCSRCRLNTRTTFGAARMRLTIVCRGCHWNIRLQDHEGSVQRGRRQFVSALQGIFDGLR